DAGNSSNHLLNSLFLTPGALRSRDDAKLRALPDPLVLLRAFRSRARVFFHLGFSSWLLCRGGVLIVCVRSVCTLLTPQLAHQQLIGAHQRETRPGVDDPR